MENPGLCAIQYSNTPILQYSNTPILQYSNTPILQYSNTPILQYSIAPARSSEHVAKHRVAQLGLEPRALGRHEAAGVGDAHEVFNARREQTERAGIVAA